MRYLLALLIACLTTADIFGWSLSLAPGLSVKNGMIYLILLALAARFVVSREIRLELPTFQLWFGILLAYSTLSWLLAGFVIKYKTFDLLNSGIDLKQLFDNAIVFVVFLYGPRTLQEAEFQLKCMLLAVAVANAVAIGNVAGVLNVGYTVVGTESVLAGRVYGAFGHANETAALIACLLPAYIAAAMSRARAAAPLWILGGMTSGTLLILTGSRGAFVSLALAAIFGSWLCRNLISWRRAAAAVVIGGAIAIPLLAFASMQSGGVLFHRIAEMILNPSAEDDRTFIWGPVFDRMTETPLSLITGFGWGAYDSMAFPRPTHNQYLMQWFELGILGVISFLIMIRELVLTALRAAKKASDDTARYLIAFVYGIIALSCAIFFTQLGYPWIYIWAYTGLTMRMAVIAQQTTQPHPRQAQRRVPRIGSPAAVALAAKPRERAIPRNRL